jgi:hypothetical protein
MKEGRFAVVSHDAGGAEILSSFLKLSGWRRGLGLLAGPAEGVFSRKFPSLRKVRSLSECVGISELFCGTSFPARLEWSAIAWARSQGVKSIAILDHWVNYRQRFERDAVFQFPDEVWVCDLEALRVARSQLPETNIRLIENPYKLQVIEEYSRLIPRGRDARVCVLYVTEPTSVAAERIYGDQFYFGYSELSALNDFLLYFQPSLGKREVIVRPHPTESGSKYDWVLKYPGVRVNSSTSLIEQMAIVDVVVGCNSMAMVVATWVGKRVVCSIPKGGRGFSLPRDGIEFLNNDAAVSFEC